MKHERIEATASELAVGTSSSLLIEPNSYRVWAALSNGGATDVWLALGEAAVTGKGIYLKAGGGAVVFDLNMPWKGEVRGIATAAVNIGLVDVGVVP